MFGYVRPFKPYMRMFEYDIYKAVYCGLCKDMGRRYGFVTRFTLSYDFAFLSLMDLSVRGVKLDAEKQRCIAHPLKKTMCAKCTCNLKYTSSAAVILTYHKLRDDIADKGLKGKLAAFVLLPFFKKPYKKAARLYPDLAPAVENAMELQNKIEREKTAGIDRSLNDSTTSSADLSISATLLTTCPTTTRVKATIRSLQNFHPPRA